MHAPQSRFLRSRVAHARLLRLAASAGHQSAAHGPRRRSCESRRRPPPAAAAHAPQELVRESERRRFNDTANVDKVIELDQVWRDGASRAMSASAALTLPSALQAGQLQQGVQQPEQVCGEAEDCARRCAPGARPLSAPQAKEDASSVIAECEALDKQRTVLEARRRRAARAARAEARLARTGGGEGCGEGSERGAAEAGQPCARQRASGQ